MTNWYTRERFRIPPSDFYDNFDDWAAAVRRHVAGITDERLRVGWETVKRFLSDGPWPWQAIYACPSPVTAEDIAFADELRAAGRLDEGLMRRHAWHWNPDENDVG